MNNFQIVTVSSGKPFAPYYLYEEFFASCRKYGCEPIVLGSKPNEFKGLGDKPKLLFKAIKDGTIKSSHIIFCDCYDLVFAANPSRVMDRFFSHFDKPWVCSTEKNCFPTDLTDKFPECGTSYRYLNSGFIVAETSAMLAVLEHLKLENVPEDYRMENGQTYHVNDQFLLQQAFLDKPVPMALDYNCELCWSMCGVKPDEISYIENMIVNNETGIMPLAIHLNGPSKTDGLREPILKHLGF